MQPLQSTSVKARADHGTAHALNHDQISCRHTYFTSRGLQRALTVDISMECREYTLQFGNGGPRRRGGQAAVIVNHGPVGQCGAPPPPTALTGQTSFELAEAPHPAVHCSALHGTLPSTWIFSSASQSGEIMTNNNVVMANMGAEQSVQSGVEAGYRIP